jgi:serine/threonine-protein kinase HipA
MDREAVVYVDLDGAPRLVGRLWARARKNQESATFEYDSSWLEHPARFSLEPALRLGPGPFHTSADTPMFGAIGDSAPDRWGRALMRRIERRQSQREGRPLRTLQEIDYLLLVDDEAGQGALRFAEREGGPFVRAEAVERIPPLVELLRLLSAAEHVVEGADTEEDLRLLFAPGSSLGGARPKASIREKNGISLSQSFRARMTRSIPCYGKLWLFVWHIELGSRCPLPASRISATNLFFCCGVLTVTGRGVSLFSRP